MIDPHKIIHEYLVEIQKILQSGDAREHAYRPAFQRLIQGLKPEIQVINEPAYTGGNAPDFLFKSGATPVAYAECKDVTVDIANSEVQKQANRYVEAFGRILLTNYFDFQILSEEGEVVAISIADKDGDQIIAKQSEFERFTNIIQDYITPFHRTIRSARKLAEIMASKARILRDNALASLTENPDSDIYAQYRTFKEVLIRELSEQEFADMYAQTLVYGLFVARYYDSTVKTFSRHEAQDLLPASNPLLKKFFGHVAGTDYDPKIAWLVDSLVEAYLSANVYELMHKEFATKQKDPVLHFYETFLAEYDKGLRKNRGVYYTPEPIVSFIVRSIDEILKSKFNLPKGLADTSMIDHEEKLQGEDARRKDGMRRRKNQIHRVQVLDPAVGTGTFLNEVINVIFKSFKGQEGLWPSYVKDHLLPRIHGFELMMASYTMAHLKLGVTLKELGYSGSERLSVWLTNSLEESVHEAPNLFMSQWLTEESHEASRIKSELPIMVVLGNPPYSVSSANKGDDIMNLIQVYKKNLNERNIQPLSDDYIKFIRFAESQIEKSGCGVVAMITNNSFIDGVTHRQMRKHLMETFDEIYILDLHGNEKKKETAPDGSRDENVFSIRQGVSINLFIKTGVGKELAKVFHSEMFGRKKDKFNELDTCTFSSLKWKEVKTSEPYFFFVPKDFEGHLKYEEGFSVDALFTVSGSGIKFRKDNLLVKNHNNPESIHVLIDDMQNLEKEEILKKYSIKETPDWKIDEQRRNFVENENAIVKVLYRPFEYKWTYYNKDTVSHIIPRGDSRRSLMAHMLSGPNIGLLTCRQQSSFDFQHVFVTKNIADMCSVSLQSKESGYLFPLYIYHEDGTKAPNLNQIIWNKINKTVGQVEPEDVFDYIYAVLHSINYREKYKEFLKIDFPRVPYPKDKNVFNKLVKLGRELRGLHLLESEKVNKFITTFPVGGSSLVEKKYPRFEGGNVYINDTQCFGNVPEAAWGFYVGGYQPAQKWLKDRGELELSMEDIEHYQKMIVAMSETIKIMEKIDLIIEI